MTSYWCPLNDGDDFPGSTNCGGAGFGSRLAVDIHYAEEHLHLAVARVTIPAGAVHPRQAAARLQATAAPIAVILRSLQPFTGSGPYDFHGAPPIPGSHGWGQLGLAAGVGQGLPQARYVIWSQGTPIAWYINDSTGEGWVFPEGDYYVYDLVASRHQAVTGAAITLAGEHMTGRQARDALARLTAAHTAAWTPEHGGEGADPHTGDPAP